MKFFFLSIHNLPSGGTKVLNQMVNLCREKGFQSYLVTKVNQQHQASFLTQSAPVIGLSQFKQRCKKNDFIINCWQHKDLHQAVASVRARIKVFWHHGVAIPVYPNFNGEKIYQSKIYDQFWNVSQACADFIKKKYNLKKVSLVYPFFDDKTLLSFKKKSGKFKRKGILCLRRRGSEVLPNIINLFPKQKITALNSPFTDKELYEQLVKHEFFISYDNGLNGKILIKNKYQRFLYKLARIKQNLSKQYVLKRKEIYSNKWIKPKENLLGFPMTACEAAWLGTTVIGFAMGGGLEWMAKDNMYLAKDGDIDSLLDKIRQAVDDSQENLNYKRKKAFKAVSKFNKNKTWDQITKLLGI